MATEIGDSLHPTRDAHAIAVVRLQHGSSGSAASPRLAPAATCYLLGVWQLACSIGLAAVVVRTTIVDELVTACGREEVVVPAR